jgi:hypothetical protein
MKNRDQQDLIPYLAANIGFGIGSGLVLWLLFALFNMPVLTLFFGWLTGALLIIAYKVYRYYKA